MVSFNSCAHLICVCMEMRESAEKLQLRKFRTMWTFIFPALASGTDAVYLCANAVGVSLAHGSSFLALLAAGRTHFIVQVARMTSFARPTRKLQIRRCITAAHRWLHLFIKLSSCESRCARKERTRLELLRNSSMPCCKWRPALWAPQFSRLPSRFLCCAAIFISRRSHDSHLPVPLRRKLHFFLSYFYCAAETRVCGALA